MPFALPFALEQEVGTLIRLLNPYTRVMHYDNTTLPLPQVTEVKAAVEKEASSDHKLSDQLSLFSLEVDNRYGSQNGGNYLFWEFKGQPQTVKKALRIEFRHPVNGVWITDHLLVGYAGSNGGG